MLFYQRVSHFYYFRQGQDSKTPDQLLTYACDIATKLRWMVVHPIINHPQNPFHNVIMKNWGGGIGEKILAVGHKMVLRDIPTSRPLRLVVFRLPTAWLSGEDEEKPPVFFGQCVGMWAHPRVLEEKPRMRLRNGELENLQF